MRPPADGYILWGSDCRDCGNTTPDSMVCDECKTTDWTIPLWVEREELSRLDAATMVEAR